MHTLPGGRIGFDVGGVLSLKSGSGHNWQQAAPGAYATLLLLIAMFGGTRLAFCSRTNNPSWWHATKKGQESWVVSFLRSLGVFDRFQHAVPYRNRDAGKG